MAHAKRIYSIAAHPEYVVASLIVKRVRSGKLAGEMSLRDIERTIAGHEAEVVRLAVEVLEDLGWCRTAVVKRPGGGRPSERVTFNPRGKA